MKRVILAVITIGLACLDPIQARIGTFWHVTDFHLDVNYTTDGDTSNMCWKSKSALTRRAGVRGSSNRKPGVYGDYLCDAPIHLVQSAVEAMQEIQPNPDFIMWTGDDTAHVADKYFSTDKVIDIIGRVTNILRKSFPTSTFLPVLGNHDYFPKNQFPPGTSDLQTRVADLWKDWLQELDGDAFESFQSSGRYLTDLKNTRVSVMALNTLIWYKSNNETAHNQTAEDPDGQFVWADEKLTLLAKGDRKVYLMGHIPPGSFERYQQKSEGFHWYQERYNKKFIKLIQKHSDVIAAQFFAHHHTDSFRLFFEDDRRDAGAKPLSYQLLAPGVTPWKSTLSEETGANNPGIRLISYDTETGQLTEVKTYYLNLAEANQNAPKWELEYTFTSYYGLSELSPASLFNMTRDMKEDKELFDKYYQANTVKYEDPSVCSSKCHKLHWCSITEIDYDRFHKCNAGSSLIPISTPILLAIACLFWMTR